MDIGDNPNYYFGRRPYKSKYICCACRKVFKRRIALDIKTESEQVEVQAKCPECGQLTTYIGPKFRAPKSDNIKAWESIQVLSDIGALNFMGFASGKMIIPESKKGLTDLLTEMKIDIEKNIRLWLSIEYDEGNKEQIKFLSDIAKQIDVKLKR